MRKVGIRLMVGAAVAVLSTLFVGIASAVAAPSVLVGVHEELDRTHRWQVEKSVDHTDLTLSVGQTSSVTYTVKLKYLGYVDSNYEVNDGINIEGDEFTINALSDVDVTASGVTGNPLACSGSWSPFTPTAFPFTGTFLACRYELGLGDTLPGVGGVGTVDVSATTSAGVANGQVGFDFNAPDQVTVYDECVDLTDSFYGPIGTFCAPANGLPTTVKTLTYTRQIGPYAQCGEDTITNTASYDVNAVRSANDSGAAGSAQANVHVRVPCVGCTLTQGYWKTHSREGPAPYDAAWKNLGPLEEDTPFFGNASRTWYTVFWTPPAGSAWYILAHQYMAAKLNILDGASSTTAVNAAISWAESYFSSNNAPPASISKSLKSTLTSYASTLDKYNNGLIGPGHCDE